MIEALSKDATNKTAYYAGRCTGDVVITAVGGVEFVYGLITTISGGSGSAAALATGIGIAAEPVTIAVTAEGVVTVVDGVNTIHYGITAFKKDADKGKEAKEADSKAAESGSGNKPYTNSRPSYGKNQVNEVWENAKDPITGKVYDPSGVEITWDKTKSRNGQWDMGHIPGEKYSEMHQLYMDDVISKDEFLEWYRNPKNYRPELPGTNRSHKYE